MSLKDDLVMTYNFTVQEAIVFEWQFDMMGGFHKSLMETISRADNVDRTILSQAFPDHVQAFVSWSQGTLWEELKMKMDEYPDVFNRFKL